MQPKQRQGDGCDVKGYGALDDQVNGERPNGKQTTCHESGGDGRSRGFCRDAVHMRSRCEYVFGLKAGDDVAAASNHAITMIQQCCRISFDRLRGLAEQA
jgi:hypothetical protein